MIEGLLERVNFIGHGLGAIASGLRDAVGGAVMGAVGALRDRLGQVFGPVFEKVGQLVGAVVGAVRQIMEAGAAGVAWVQNNVPGVKGISDAAGWAANVVGSWKTELWDRIAGPDKDQVAVTDLVKDGVGHGVGFVLDVVKTVASGAWDYILFPLLNRVLQSTGVYALIGLVVLVLVLGYFGASGARAQRWVPRPMTAVKVWALLQGLALVAALLSVTGLITQSLLLYPTEDAANVLQLQTGNFRLLTAYGWQADGSFQEGVRFAGESFRIGKPVSTSVSGRVLSVGFDDPTDPYAGSGLTVAVQNRYLGTDAGTGPGAIVRYGGLSPYYWPGQVRADHGPAGGVGLRLMSVDSVGARVPAPTFTEPFTKGRGALSLSNGAFAVMVPTLGTWALEVSPPSAATLCSVSPGGSRSGATADVTIGPAHPWPARVDVRIAYPWDETVVDNAATGASHVVHHAPDCGFRSSGSSAPSSVARQLPLVAAGYGAPVLVPSPPLPPLIWPVSSDRVTQEFGESFSCPYSPMQCVVDGIGGHTGIDLALPVGTPVVASADGELLHTYDPLGGPAVYIVHRELGLETRYQHLSDNTVHSEGRVRAGEVIGLSGSSGTGPHLHYEVVLLSDCSYSDPRARAVAAADASIENPERAVGIPDGHAAHALGRSAWDGCGDHRHPGGVRAPAYSVSELRGPLVRPGDDLAQGQRLGYVGMTGERKGEAYVSFQIYFPDRSFDPRALLPAGSPAPASAPLATALCSPTTAGLTCSADPLSFLPRCSVEFSIGPSDRCGGSGQLTGSFTPLLLPACFDPGPLPDGPGLAGAARARWEQVLREGRQGLCSKQAQDNYAYDPGGVAGGGRRLLGVFGYPRPFTPAEIAAFNAFASRSDWAPVPGAIEPRAADPVLRYASYIRSAAEREHVPASLIAAVIAQESGGDATAVRSDIDHATGLMQVTLFWWGARPDIAPAQRIDPGTNIAAGAFILGYERSVAQREGLSGDELWRAVVARYHGGWRAYSVATRRIAPLVDAAGAATPDHTRAVLALRERYRDLDR